MIDVAKKYRTESGYDVCLMHVMGNIESELYPIFGAYYSTETNEWIQDCWTLDGAWLLDGEHSESENLNLVEVPDDPHTSDPDITRADILDEAQRIVSGDRDQQYGSPEDSFQRIADYWNAYTQHKRMLGWGTDITPEVESSP